jgi:predicted AAA+ superfamily ATPase
MQIDRYLKSGVREWLDQRMVFIGGPRQVGKTYLAKEFIASTRDYFTWDDLADREQIKSHRFPSAAGTLVLDEVHKYPSWRSLLKGLYDKNAGQLRFLVTGSARLDHFRRGGDSLFGRYHYFRLHPFSFGEVDAEYKRTTLEALLAYGGFPEPFIRHNARFARIWRRERIARVVHQDLRDLTNLKDYHQLELLADLLPSKVGSLLSLNSIAEDLAKSPHTIANWIDILGSVYQCYTVPPYGPPKIKANRKQQKLYLWDWSTIEDEGPRFENLVASHLLKYCHWVEDTEGHRMELRFLKDQQGHEVDFVVLKDKRPLLAVECKSGERAVSPSLRYFQGRIPCDALYQVHTGARSYQQDGIRVMPFGDFCRQIGV